MRKKRGISRREFAKRDECSEGLVRHGLKRGHLTAYDDGTLDPAVVGTQWRKRDVPEPEVVPAAPEADVTQLESFADAQRRKENMLARLRELELALKRGDLLDAKTVRTQVFALAREDRDALTGWPSRVAPLIAAELGVDPVKLAVLLDVFVRKFLAERAQLRKVG